MTNQKEIAKLDKDIEICFSEIYLSNGKGYNFKLCCPVIRNLELDCPKKNIAFKIPKCVSLKISNEIVTFNITDNITFEYLNIDNSNIYETAIITSDNNNYFIQLQTNENVLINKLCVKKIIIKVEPVYFQNKFINKKINFSVNKDNKGFLGEWVCFEEINNDTQEEQTADDAGDNLLGVSDGTTAGVSISPILS